MMRVASLSAIDLNPSSLNMDPELKDCVAFCFWMPFIHPITYQQQYCSFSIYEYTYQLEKVKGL